MDDVIVQVRLERLEVGSLPSPEELILQMPEDLLGRAVVDAAPEQGLWSQRVAGIG